MKIRIAACLLVVCSIVSCSQSDETSNQRFKELSDQIENLRREIKSVKARLQEPGQIYMTVKAHLKESDFKQNSFSEQLAAHRQAVDQAVAAMGTAKPDEIRDTLRLRKLEIVNEQGTTLATFSTVGDSTRLEIGSTTGKGRILMLAGGSECVAQLSDRDGSVTLGGAGITVSALTENEIAQLDLMADDDPEYHAKKKTLVKIGRGEGDRSGMITVFNPYGKRVVTVKSHHKHEGVVSVFDVNGKLKDWLGE